MAADIEQELIYKVRTLPLEKQKKLCRRAATAERRRRLTSRTPDDLGNGQGCHS